jgi:3-deoxy-manno-octulosonate cytidylyltransferase (CMP-KDO synthetase)
VRVVGIIPARLAATRLPNKPLLDIHGKPMVQRVWERARQASRLADVLVATPDEAIRDAVTAFGGRAVMTGHQHRSGTDRLAEAAASLDADVIVNIQGDEPLIEPDAIDASVEPFERGAGAQMASLMCCCPEPELDSPTTVKVVCALDGTALYFSRTRIPFARAPEGAVRVMQHIGLYAYRRDFLLTFAGLEPSPLERTELLEQLRVLEHGYRIHMVEIARAPLSVDTAEDLERVRRIIGGTA